MVGGEMIGDETCAYYSTSAVPVEYARDQCIFQSSITAGVF